MNKDKLTVAIVFDDLKDVQQLFEEDYFDHENDDLCEVSDFKREPTLPSISEEHIKKWWKEIGGPLHSLNKNALEYLIKISNSTKTAALFKTYSMDAIKTIPDLFVDLER